MTIDGSEDHLIKLAGMQRKEGEMQAHLRVAQQQNAAAQQEAERARFIVDKALQEKKSVVIKVCRVVSRAI